MSLLTPLAAANGAIAIQNLAILCGYAVYNSFSSTLTPEHYHCYPTSDVYWHSSCPKIIELVQDVLQKGELKNIYRPEETIPPMNILFEKISCGVHFGDYFDCGVYLKEICNNLLPYNWPLAGKAFKAIPGSDLINKIHVSFLP